MDGEWPFDDGNGNAAFGRLFQKFLAQYGSALLQNNEYLQAENAARTGLLDLLKADASNNTVLNALTAKAILLAISDTTSNCNADGIHLALLNGLFLKTGTNGKSRYSYSKRSYSGNRKIHPLKQVL